MSLRYTLSIGAAPEAPAAPAEAPTLVGERGEVYTLGAAVLGVGGQDEVWPARRQDGTWVAIKLAHPVPALCRDVQEEATLLRTLQNAGATCTVPCLDVVASGVRTGFVMPLYPGDVETLVARIIAGTDLGGERPRAARPEGVIEAVLGVAARLARAIGELHQVELPGVHGRIVHRDIKPDNVLVDAEGGLHIADLGGHLVVEGITSLDLGVFGTPMWAPFDQMLPGHPEPNPTWDTYAACVLLFWWVTGGRPDYQSDPEPMLTATGREAWHALQRLARAEESTERREAAVALQRARGGKRAADLVDVRGHAAIQDADRAAIAAGVRRLANAEVYGAEALLEAERGLCDLLARGLSPLSHPSPPNRYWNALDLAEEIDGITRRLVAARGARTSSQEKAALEQRVHRLEADAGRRQRPGPGVRALLAGLGATAVGGVGLLSLAIVIATRDGPITAVDEAIEAASGPDVVRVEGGPPLGEADAAPLAPFAIHRTEVSNRAYAACVERGVCTVPAWKIAGSEWEIGVGARGDVFAGLTDDALPVVGVTWSQATTFCAWAGGRLPGEAEWEKAAFGVPGQPTSRRTWPWGDAPADCDHAQLPGCGGRPLPVDALPAGASAWGAVQMVGNVWEWTNGSYRSVKKRLLRKIVEEHRVLRGLAWDTEEPDLAERRHVEPDTVSPVQGFRCVFDG